MKRDPALQPLSRDHHQALFVAQRLRRASSETATEARDDFLGYWQSHGRHHFRAEEEVLLPAYAGHGDPGHPLVTRVLAEHVEIRHRAHELERRPAASLDALALLGTLLADHVRLEERELFPLIEEALPEDELAELAARLDAAGDAPEA